MRMKKQAMARKKIFANYLSDKGLLSRVCKKLSRLNNEKQCNLLIRETINLPTLIYKFKIQ